MNCLGSAPTTWERIEKAVLETRLLQREFVPRLREARWLPRADSERQEAEILRDKIRKKHPREPVVAVVDCQLNPDLIVCEYRSASVVTTFDWENQYSPPPLKYHLIHQLASGFLNFAADLSDDQMDDWAHRETPVGCIFDWYNDEVELRRTMIAGRVCPQHRADLGNMGVTGEQLSSVEELLEAVRRAAIGTPKRLGTAVFVGHGHNADWTSVQTWIREQGLEVEEFNAKPNVGNANTEVLKRMLERAGAAVMVMSAEVEHAMDHTLHARENVVHEIGLLQGRLGFERVAILKDSQVANFSNIEGLTVIPFQTGRFEASSDAQRQLRGFLEGVRLVEPAASPRQQARRGRVS